jgi:hypothetical protein
VSEKITTTTFIIDRDLSSLVTNGPPNGNYAFRSQLHDYDFIKMRDIFTYRISNIILGRQQKSAGCFFVAGSAGVRVAGAPLWPRVDRCEPRPLRAIASRGLQLFF